MVQQQSPEQPQEKPKEQPHEQPLPKPITGRTAFWAIAFFIGMFGTPILGRYLNWGTYLTMGAMMLPMLLLIPLVKSAERGHSEAGAVSPAIQTYNRRALIWSFSYVVALFFAVAVFNSYAPTGALAWAIAILPALPILYFIWSLGRYLIDESDEYLKMQQVSNALFATGLLLTVATFWGFLETFELVPHVPGWAAIPIWAIGLGLRPIWQSVRGQ
jgi:hypothetical protein